VEETAQLIAAEADRMTGKGQGKAVLFKHMPLTAHLLQLGPTFHGSTSSQWSVQIWNSPTIKPFRV
jgi:hypothetical protein